MRYLTLFLIIVYFVNVNAQDATGRSPKLNFSGIKQQEQINQNSTDVSKLFVDDLLINIPAAKTINNNAVAVIIGNKDYISAPKVDFAINDAKAMKEYVIKAFGYKPENIIYVENAKQSDLYTIFGKEGFHKGKLFNYVQKGLSEVYIYYSGHGAPDIDQKSGYLVPVDCDPNTVVLNGYSLTT